ncbi:MAG: sensor domain-containing diguanylate cyclase [Myxococcales bacterium]|nr:sensor domain-containing diguanylate cyclase [Myxococcales bacterium]MCB9715649.1 sensor domain-containing diguanylate cyclase [Myxococcales bacterium]
MSAHETSLAMMSAQLEKLTELARELQQPQEMEAMLQRIVERSAELLDVPHVSVRLLDPTRTRLLSVVRAGESMHADSDVVFVFGEGLIGWIAAHAEPIRTGHASDDPRFVVKPELTRRLGSFLGVPLVAGARCMGVLSAVHPEADHFGEHDEQLAVLVAAICAPRVEAARLERLSGTDPLTGALNRRGFDREFPEVRVASGDLASPLSVAMADVDHFKRVNDGYGHAVGDEVLKAVGRILGESVRSDDAVVRYGGEEFLLVLPQVDREGALKVAERARATVEEAVLHPAYADLRVTISIGVAERRPHEPRAALVERADAAMYRAKQLGRNRVVASD